MSKHADAAGHWDVWRGLPGWVLRLVMLVAAPIAANAGGGAWAR